MIQVTKEEANALYKTSQIKDGEIFELEGAYAVFIQGKMYGNSFGKNKKNALKVVETLVRDGWYPVSDGPIKKAFRCAYCGKTTLLASSQEPPENMNVKQAKSFVKEVGRACSCRS